MRLAGVLLSLILLGACEQSLAELGCDEVAARARRLSEDQDMKIVALAKVTETSRTEHDVRCRADATWSDNATTPVYVRAYDEGENRMVAYQPTPFE
jgi:hypothetical protein